jgi:regulator of protease activity HflC (stomatin/prohibitin superfamily)
MKGEKLLNAMNGYIAIVFCCLLLMVTILAVSIGILWMFIASVVLLLLILFGLTIVKPNTAKVLVLFGAYRGTINSSGLVWVNPFFARASISLRARNFESDKVKVNDKLGNPILISVILVWKVKDTYKSSFEVDNYEDFVKIQTDSAVRKLAGTYPYDHFEDERANITLSTNFDTVNRSLESEIAERLTMAGIEVIEARIGYLAYAPEIAQVMLRRQQASAVVAARHKIVEGAVGMVENALKQLSEKSIINLDDERKAAMVSNLMVVLCGDKDSQPVLNTGTLNH